MARSDTRPRPAGVAWIVIYPLYAVFAAMVFLSAQELTQPPPKPGPRPVAADDPQWESKFPARVDALQKALSEAGLQLALTREREQGAGALRWTHRFYDLTIPKQADAEVEAKLLALQVVDPGVNLVTENVFNGRQVLVGIDGLLTHTLRLYWAGQAARPRVSLVVGMLGDDLRLAREVINIDAPLALCIAPFRPFSAQVAELGQLFERDVLLCWRGAEEGGTLEAALAAVPGATGVVFVGSDDSAASAQEIESRGLLHFRAGGTLADAGESGAIETFALSRGEPAKVRAALLQQARQAGRAVGVVEVEAGRVDQLEDLLGTWRDAKLELVPLARLRAVPIAAGTEVAAGAADAAATPAPVQAAGRR